jgi:hypothetical protein
MEIVRHKNGHTGRIEAHLVMTRRGDWIHAVVSVKSPMQATSEFADHDALEKAEAYGIRFAQRHHAHILYIDDRT